MNTQNKQYSEAASRPYLDRSRIEEPLLLILAMLTISVAILFGGAPNEPGWRLSIILACASLLAVTSLFRGAFNQFLDLGIFAKLFLISVLMLPLIQIIPLPPDIWQSFPGRGIELQVFEMVGAAQNWHSISLNPVETLFVLITIIPAAAVFLAALKLNSIELRFLVCGIIFLALVSIVVGLFQFSMKGGLFNFYNSSHKQFLLGFFANRNHQGLFLAISLSLTVDLIFRITRKRSLALVLSGLAIFFFVGAAVATTSRAGLSLTILAAFLVFLLNNWRGVGTGRLVAILVSAAGVFVLVFQSIGAVFKNVVERYSVVGDDLRWQFWEQSGVIISNYFPFGTGLGTFVPVYQQFEPLEHVMPTFANHVHNDYYEFILETGLGGIFVLLLFLLAVGVAIGSKIGSETSLTPRFHWIALIIVVLILLHSIVDYPLRTQAIAVLLGLCLAVILKKSGKHVPEK